MGDLLDSIKKRFDYVDKSVNPMRKVGDAIQEAGKQMGNLTGGQDLQSAYEKKQAAMNKAYEVKTVDDSIQKKEF